MATLTCAVFSNAGLSLLNVSEGFKGFVFWSFHKVRFTRGRRKTHHHHFPGFMMMICSRKLLRGIDYWRLNNFTQDLQNASNGGIWAHSARWQPRLSHSHLRVLFSARLESTQCLGRFRQIYQTESAESAEPDLFWEFVELRNRTSRISRIRVFLEICWNSDYNINNNDTD